MADLTLVIFPGRKVTDEGLPVATTGKWAHLRGDGCAYEPLKGVEESAGGSPRRASEFRRMHARNADLGRVF